MIFFFLHKYWKDGEEEENNVEEIKKTQHALYPLILKESSVGEFPTIVKCIGEEYFHKIVEFVQDFYMPRNNLYKLLGMSSEGFIEYSHKLFDWLEDGTSLVCFNENDKILGFIIGSLWSSQDWQRESERCQQYETQEMQAVFDLYNNFHKNVDLFIVNNTDIIYNIYIWVISPYIKKKSYVIYELFMSLKYFCEQVGVGAISAMAIREHDKIFAEQIGFQVVDSVYYLECFDEYDIGKNLEQDYFGYFLSLSLKYKNKKDFHGEKYDVLHFPQSMKTKKKRRGVEEWHNIYWSAFEKDYFTPAAFKKFNLDYILI